MTAISTARHQLPYLVVGQAQKEITHNQALVRIDALLHPLVEAELTAPPAPLTESQAGKCWLVGASATGDWTGKQKQIACWDGGGWQFITPMDSMRLFNKAIGSEMAFKSDAWVSNNPISNASGGNIVDVEARNSVNQLLSALKNIGILPS
jgi:hypothetical protein